MAAPYHNKALPPGTVLREWRLEQVLGVGGFGIVYRARGIYFDELVAIKEYFPSAIADRRDGDTVVPTDSSAEEVHALGLKKFVEEAKLLWNLSKPTRHPNIVSVRSLFEIHGTAYMVMDFESGVSLSQILRKGQKFDETSLLALVKPIAEGLERAHRVGVLHRDIKPANILVGEDGRPVLIDFGSARFETGEATNTKVTFHTPPYAAIEQYVKTYSQGPWTDIYALGVVLYECITGEKPPEVLERLHGGLGEALAGKAWPGYSKAFLRAVDAAMIIRPEERPQSISKWLALFDADDETAAGEYDDDATRVVVLQDLVQPSLAKIEKEAPEKMLVAMPGEAPQPVTTAATKRADTTAAALAAASAAAAPDSAAMTRPGQPRAGGTRASKAPWRSPLIMGIAAFVALCLGLLLFLRTGMQAKPSGATAQTAAPGAPALTVAAPGVDPGAIAGIGVFPEQLGGLVDSAKRAGRPHSELNNLKAGKSGVEAIIADIQKLAPDPKAGAAVQQKLAELSSLILKTASGEAAALGRDARNRLQKLKATVPWGDLKGSAPTAPDEQPAYSALRDAKASLDAADAAATAATDPASAIAATQRALSAFQSFGAAVTAASGMGERYALPAKRAGYATLDSATRALVGRVTQLATTERPGLFANKAKRDSWRTRQDNATKAKALTADLDRLTTTVRNATTAAEIESAVEQANGIYRQLSALYAASYAALQSTQRGQQPAAATSPAP